MNVAEWMARREEIDQGLVRLGKLQLMMDSLYSASQHLYTSDEWGKRADALLVQVCREVVLTSERVWELSGPDRVQPELPTTPEDQEAAHDYPF